MKTFLSPLQMIAIGGILVVVGLVLPLLMVLRVIPASFALCFFSYAASVVGLVLGIVGSALYARLHRPPDRG